MTDRYFNSVDFAGSDSGGGAGFTLGPAQNVFTGADRAEAMGVRDAYNLDNPGWVANYNADTSLNIRLEFTEGANAIAVYQVRNDDGNAWLDNESFEALRGEPGQDGSGTDFSSISSNHIPAIGSDDRPFDSGLIVDANGDIETPRSLQTGPGSVRIGPGFSLSNGVQTMAISKSTGQKALAVIQEYDNTGSTDPFYYQLGAEQTLDVNLLSDVVIPAPYELNYTTFGDNLTLDFTFIPNEAGDIRLRYWLGTGQDGMLIFDETRTVEASEVGNPVTFGVGNPYLLNAGVSIFVRSEGVDLRGTLVNDPDSPFNGQNLLYFRSTIQPFTRVTFAEAEDIAQSDWNESDNSSNAFILNKPTIPEAGENNVQSNWNETDTNSDAFILNKPNIPADTNDFVDSLTAEVSGQNLTITLGRTGTLDDLSQTVTLPGGGTTPSDGPDSLYYGLSSSNDPATVDLSTLTGPVDATDPQTVTTGVAAQGDYFIILSANTHDITAITDTVLNQPVLDIFTKTNDVRTEGGVTYDSYVIGPLNADLNESYVLEF